MSRLDDFDAIAEALHDGCEEEAKRMFLDLVREVERKGYEEGLQDLRETFLCDEEEVFDLEEAKVLLRRGDRAEALIYLERFLGADFVGLLVRPGERA